MRKPRFKKDYSNLRGKGAQYQELTEALDLLLDGPSSKDSKFLMELSNSAGGSKQLMPPRTINMRHRNRGGMAQSMQPGLTSPFAGTGASIMAEQ